MTYDNDNSLSYGTNCVCSPYLVLINVNKMTITMTVNVHVAAIK